MTYTFDTKGEQVLVTLGYETEGKLVEIFHKDFFPKGINKAIVMDEYLLSKGFKTRVDFYYQAI